MNPKLLSLTVAVCCMLIMGTTAFATETTYSFAPGAMIAPPDPTNQYQRWSDIQMATDGLQKAKAVYSDQGEHFGTSINPARTYIAESVDGGTSWSEPRLLIPVTESRYAYDPDIATDGHGTWVVMWETQHTDGESVPESRLYSQKFADDGTPLNTATALPEILGYSRQFDRHVTLTTYGNGVWLAAYMTRSKEMPGPYADLAIARSLDNGETWETYLPSETTAIGVDFNPPEIHADPVSRTAKVVFTTYKDSERHVCVATLDSAGELSDLEKIQAKHLIPDGDGYGYISPTIGFKQTSKTWIVAWIIGHGIHDVSNYRATFARAGNGEKFSSAEFIGNPVERRGEKSVKLVSNHKPDNWAVFIVYDGHTPEPQNPVQATTIGYAKSDDDGLTWQNGDVISSYENAIFYGTDAVANGFGRILAMWGDTEWYQPRKSPYASFSQYDPGALLPQAQDGDISVSGGLTNLNPVANTPFQLEYTITNHANSATTAVLARLRPIDGLELAGYSFENGNPDESKATTDTLLATYTGIEPGATRTIQVQYVATSTGTYFVNGSATAEAGDIFPEDNLHRFVEVNVTAGSLRGLWHGIRTRSFAQGWTNIQSRFVMRNNTNQVEAPAYAVIYKSEDAVWDESDVPVKMMSRPSLAPGQWFQQTFSTWHNPNPSGQYYIAVINAFGSNPQPYPVQIP